MTFHMQTRSFDFIRGAMVETAMRRSGRRDAGDRGELDAVHSARDAAWAAVDAAINAQRKAKLALAIASIAAAAAILAAAVALASLYLSP
jgi:hypothetical protein